MTRWSTRLVTAAENDLHEQSRVRTRLRVTKSAKKITTAGHPRLLDLLHVPGQTYSTSQILDDSGPRSVLPVPS